MEEENEVGEHTHVDGRGSTEQQWLSLSLLMFSTAQKTDLAQPINADLPRTGTFSLFSCLRHCLPDTPTLSVIPYTSLSSCTAQLLIVLYGDEAKHNITKQVEQE